MRVKCRRHITTVRITRHIDRWGSNRTCLERSYLRIMVNLHNIPVGEQNVSHALTEVLKVSQHPATNVIERTRLLPVQRQPRKRSRRSVDSAKVDHLLNVTRVVNILRLFEQSVRSQDGIGEVVKECRNDVVGALLSMHLPEGKQKIDSMQQTAELKELLDYRMYRGHRREIARAGEFCLYRILTTNIEISDLITRGSECLESPTEEHVDLFNRYFETLVDTLTSLLLSVYVVADVLKLKPGLRAQLSRHTINMAHKLGGAVMAFDDAIVVLESENVRSKTKKTGKS